VTNLGFGGSSGALVGVLEGGCRRRRRRRRLLVVGGHLPPLVLHVEQQRNESVLQLLLELELVAERQLGDQRFRVVLHVPLQLR